MLEGSLGLCFLSVRVHYFLPGMIAPCQRLHGHPLEPLGMFPVGCECESLRVRGVGTPLLFFPMFVRLFVSRNSRLLAL